MNIGRIKLIVGLLALAPLTGLAGQSVNERWDLDATATVSIENIAGEIVIQGWDRNEAHLTGELGDSVEELEVDASRSSLQINVMNRDKRNIDSTDLNLMVPYGANIDASAVSADIDVSGLDNDKLTATSVSGDVEIRATSQRITIESVSGDVGFNGHTERISAESVSGDVDLSGISGEITATTVSGDMDLHAESIDGAKFESVSGDMTIVGALSGNARLTAESMSGDVTIMLPSSQEGLFKAQSFSGRIYTDFGSVQHAKHGPGSHLKHHVGSGGPEVRVESFSGNIKLKKD